MSERILIVEDDNALRYALSRELEAAGYDVAQAHDYRDALDLLEVGKRVSVLVVDLVLPGVNGFALARMARMKQHHVKIIYMTGFEDIPLQEADGPVLHKPVHPDVLLGSSAIACARHNRTRAPARFYGIAVPGTRHCSDAKEAQGRERS